MPNKIFAQRRICNKLVIMSNKVHNDVGGRGEFTMETENTNVHHSQLTTYRDKHKYKHRFSTAQSYMKVEQDMRLRNKLQNYCICKKGKQ